MKTVILSLMITASIALIPVTVVAQELSSDSQALTQTVAVDTNSTGPSMSNNAMADDNTVTLGDDSAAMSGNSDDDSAMSDNDENSEGLSSGDDSLAAPSSANK